MKYTVSYFQKRPINYIKYVKRYNWLPFWKQAILVTEYKWVRISSAGASKELVDWIIANTHLCGEVLATGGAIWGLQVEHATNPVNSPEDYVSTGMY